MNNYMNMIETYRKKIHHVNDSYLGESATDAQNAVYDRLLEIVYGEDRLPF